MKAIMHVHSEFSFDGEVSLERIAGLCIRNGIEAVFLTEHEAGLGDDRYRVLKGRAAALSLRGPVIVPGLEIEVPGGGEILALGVERIPGGDDLRSLAESIHSEGGIAILTHPERFTLFEASSLELLDGIEVWNGRYDSKYLPGHRGLSLLRIARWYNRDVFGCCGIDLHTESDWFPLTIDIEAGIGDKPLTALKEKPFTYGNNSRRLKRDWLPGVTAMAAIGLMNVFYRTVRLAPVPVFLSRLLRRVTGNR